MNPKQFVTDVLTQVWQHGDVKRIDDYYAQDITGEISGEAVSIDDLRNRAKFVNEKMTEVVSEIVDVVAEDKLIIGQMKQTYVMRDTGEEKHYDLLFKYRLNDENKVEHIFGLIYPPVDYKEKA